MTIARNVSEAWSTPVVNSTQPTLVQVHAGAIYLDIGGAATDLDDGLFLVQDPARPLRDSFVVPANMPFRFRRAGKRSTKVYYGALS